MFVRWSNMCRIFLAKERCCQLLIPLWNRFWKLSRVQEPDTLVVWMWKSKRKKFSENSANYFVLVFVSSEDPLLKKNTILQKKIVLLRERISLSPDRELQIVPKGVTLVVDGRDKSLSWKPYQGIEHSPSKQCTFRGAFFHVRKIGIP